MRMKIATLCVAPFIQAPLHKAKSIDERDITKITGVLVHMLVQLKLLVYGPYVVLENDKKVIYV